MLGRHPLAVLALAAAPALAEPLLDALEANGFSGFAQELQGHEILSAGPGLLLYTPTNAALTAAKGPSAFVRRASQDDIKRATLAIHAVNSTTPYRLRPSQPPKNSTKVARDVPVSPGAVLVTLLSDSEFVNLGPDRNQNIVEKGVALPSLPLVLSGLGASVKVTGADIPFDNGFIRPIDGVLTLPRNISQTLPFLGADTFLALAQQTGLLAEIDNRASITVLAPDDSAFARAGTDLPDERLKDLLRRHILVDFPAYTPLLQGGDVYSTLAGGQVTVSVANGVVRVNGARILAGDAIITNGVIHTIDSVLGVSPAPSPPITAAATALMRPLSQMALACSLGGVVAASRYLHV